MMDKRQIPVHTIIGRKATHADFRQCKQWNKRIVEIMGDPAGQPPQSLELLRTVHLLLGLSLLPFGGAEFLHVRTSANSTVRRALRIGEHPPLEQDPPLDAIVGAQDAKLLGVLVIVCGIGPALERGGKARALFGMDRRAQAVAARFDRLRQAEYRLELIRPYVFPGRQVDVVGAEPRRLGGKAKARLAFAQFLILTMLSERKAHQPRSRV